MPQTPELRYDVATVASRGQRAYQEDSLIADFALGADFGFAVLADGMGGHTAGDVASKIIVTEVFSELKLQSGDKKGFEANISQILRDAALSANDCLKGHVQTHPQTRGMGSTLVAPVVLGNRLFWISIGDSPLLLFRDGKLRQLNEDHSMAPQIDFMIRAGLIEEATGRDHPDRNCLTSVLIGAEVARIDCPSEPLELRPGDVVIVASDGLQTLNDAEMERILNEYARAPAATLARELLNEVDQAHDPDQDNVSFAVIRICEAASVSHDASHGAQGDADPGARIEPIVSGNVLRPLQFFRSKPRARDGTA